MDDPETLTRTGIAVDFTGTGVFEEIREDLIIAADLYSYKEKTGGVVNGGNILLDNSRGTFSPERFGTYDPAGENYNGPVGEDSLGNLRPGRWEPWRRGREDGGLPEGYSGRRGDGGKENRGVSPRGDGDHKGKCEGEAQSDSKESTAYLRLPARLQKLATETVMKQTVFYSRPA
jgi:hypothetical protein